MMIDFEDINIRDLIPQKDPFVMVDALTYADEDSATSRWTVRGDAIFADGKILLPCAYLENMAQTCAAHLGFVDNCLHGNKEVKIGYIGSVKNLVVNMTPKTGDTLTTTIQVAEQVLDMKLINATTKIGDSVAATAELKIVVTDKTAER